MKKTWSLVLFLLLGLGCSSMESVQRYSVGAQATLDEVRPVARDFHASCLRTNRYKPLRMANACDKEKQASDAILRVTDILHHYARTLGALASDQLVDYREDVSSLTTELKGLNVQGLSEQRVNSIGSLASLIGTVATQGYQQKQVGTFIKDSHESVASVSDTLAHLLENNYQQALDLELAAWDLGFKESEMLGRDKDRLGWEIYAERQWRVKGELEAKKKATRGLAQSVKQIAATHKELKDDASSLDAPEIKALVESYLDQVKPVIQDVKAAF